MMDTLHVVGLSGGKDSTAMALALAESFMRLCDWMSMDPRDFWTVPHKKRGAP
jgi:NH3-dependent NAD+ synthetase